MATSNAYLTVQWYVHYLCLRSVEGMKVRASAEYSWSEHHQHKDIQTLATSKSPTEAFSTICTFPGHRDFMFRAPLR
jgi:hypothetical protein